MESVPSWLGRCAAWAEQCRDRKIPDIPRWKTHEGGFDCGMIAMFSFHGIAMLGNAICGMNGVRSAPSHDGRMPRCFLSTRLQPKSPCPWMILPLMSFNLFSCCILCIPNTTRRLGFRSSSAICEKASALQRFRTHPKGT